MGMDNILSVVVENMFVMVVMMFPVALFCAIGNPLAQVFIKRSNSTSFKGIVFTLLGGVYAMCIIAAGLVVGKYLWEMNFVQELMSTIALDVWHIVR